MDRVVGYDYPIDNKEEMKMEDIRVKDISGDEAEVGVLGYRTGEIKNIVTLDFDPDNYNCDCIDMMHYTPDQARKLAAALIAAADEVEKRSNTEEK